MTQVSPEPYCLRARLLCSCILATGEPCASQHASQPRCTQVSRASSSALSQSCLQRSTSQINGYSAGHHNIGREQIAQGTQGSQVHLQHSISWIRPPHLSVWMSQRVSRGNGDSGYLATHAARELRIALVDAGAHSPERRERELQVQLRRLPVGELVEQVHRVLPPWRFLPFKAALHRLSNHSDRTLVRVLEDRPGRALLQVLVVSDLRGLARLSGTSRTVRLCVGLLISECTVR